MVDKQEILRTKAFIRDLEDISGWTVSRMAKDAGFAHTTLSRFMKTDTPKHNLKFSTLSTIAKNLLDKIAADNQSPHSKNLTIQLIDAIENFGIPTRFDGTFSDTLPTELRIVEQLKLGRKHEGIISKLNTVAIKTIPYPYEMYPDTVVGIEIHDQSMDKKFPKGSILICTPFSKGAYEEADNYYIFALQNYEAQETELVCRRLSEDENRDAWLLPESADPRYTPIPLDNVLLKTKTDTTSNPLVISTEILFDTKTIAHVVGAIIKI